MNDEQRKIQQEALKEAIDLFGTQANFAKILSDKTSKAVTQKTISWFVRKGMSYKWAIPIEQVTAEHGAMIPRQRLHPVAYPD